MISERKPSREQTQAEKDAILSDAPSVVFQSRASYHPLVWVLLSFAPIVTLASIGIVYSDDSSTEAEKRQAVLALVWTTVAIVIVYALVLPRRFEVVSNASVNVVTFNPFFKWNFKNVTAAYENQSIWAEWNRPKFKFAVDLHKRVVVRRKNGRWDLLVSPKDPAGFVEEVWRVAGDTEGSSSAY